jgi:hypothetical protein
LKILDDDKFYALRLRALKKEPNAVKQLAHLKEQLKKEASKGDLDAKRKLRIIEDDEFADMIKRAKAGDLQGLRECR